ncbi:TPA: hypothetical protein ROY42_005645 [Bacillus thuringiensis]|nr:hypothetical protein [Bacillus thuringiensis]
MKKKKLNADIPAPLKKRLEIYAVTNEVFIKDIVASAIEEYLNKMES